jgi:surfeit locus 1 family protein
MWPTIMTLPAFVILLALGTWQLQRLEWKNALLSARETALAAPPITAPGEFDPARHAGRRVRLSGMFLHGKEMYSTPRPRAGYNGLRVVTPLLLADGAVVLVDRGWLPVERKSPATRRAGQIEGGVTIEGVIRAPGQPGRFVPDNQPADNIWFSFDVPAMAKAASLERVRPYLVVAGPAANPGGLPLGQPYRVEIRNDHLGYAITWYGLAAALLAVYILYARRARA